MSDSLVLRLELPQRDPRRFADFLQYGKLLQHIAKLPGLQLLGNGYRGVGLPDLIRDATAAAQQAAT